MENIEDDYHGLEGELRSFANVLMKAAIHIKKREVDGTKMTENETREYIRKLLKEKMDKEDT